MSTEKIGKDVPLKQWHHVAWVWNKSDGMHGTMTIYLDAKEVASGVETHAGAVQDNPNNATAIGYKQDSKTGFNGTIDELWIYNEALSADKIDSLMRYNNLEGTGTLARMFQPEDAVADAAPRPRRFPRNQTPPPEAPTPPVVAAAPTGAPPAAPQAVAAAPANATPDARTTPAPPASPQVAAPPRAVSPSRRRPAPDASREVAAAGGTGVRPHRAAAKPRTRMSHPTASPGAGGSDRARQPWHRRAIARCESPGW